MYCTRTDLTAYILEDYLTAADNQTEGTVATAIANVEAEMTEALVSGGYTVTEDSVPATVKRVCSVIAAYNSVCAITSLVSSETSSDNEFLPLQRKAERAEKVMAQIREGKIRLAAPAAETSQPNDTVVVISPPSRFKSPKGWGRF
ncbi:phage protein Gp36 family protein [Maridesulfovibrio sp.]|uniref:phage protein Gp36 family protein n=1 Tax=Maridesulfovibrio sp. TaxID=2795000 RepID=UPI0039F140EA